MTAPELSAGGCHNAVRNSDQPSYPCGMCPACIAADWSPQNIPLPIALRPITLTLEAAEQMRRLIDSNEPGAVGKEMPELSHLPAPLTASELSALTVRCPELAAEVQRLQHAIRRHRDYRGDDRCHLDDGELYAALPEGDTRPERETAVTIDNCRRYILSRMNPRAVYVSPQKEIERLEARVKELEQMLAWRQPT